MPTRIHIPTDWRRRATRALSNLNEPGVAAVCFWCGHEYRIGEYSPETESDHLLQCPEYPQDGKLRIQKRKHGKSTKPSVGISRSSKQVVTVTQQFTSGTTFLTGQNSLRVERYRIESMRNFQEVA
jgi:hypothetical protein